jgi:SAM-dependent methyltransferase
VNLVDSAEINRLQWDERAPAHASSPDYYVARFAQDPAFLSYVVQFDTPRLGSIDGLRGVHLQCHIGTDTISLARLGASMTGLDFSPAALTEARRIAALAGAEVDFVDADVYDAVSVLGADRFDLVYTGVGALCWLPDIRRWTRTVSDLLRPGGRLFIREFHPMMWSLEEERTDDLLVVDYPYFETPEPDESENDGTYVGTDVAFAHTTIHTWNHGLGEIIGGLLEAGMELTAFEEHRSMPSEAMPGHLGVRRASGVAFKGATGAATVDLHASGAQGLRLELGRGRHATQPDGDACDRFGRRNPKPHNRVPDDVETVLNRPVPSQRPDVVDALIVGGSPAAADALSAR